MNEFKSFGFFDFEDFVTELSDEQLIAVNGGSCGAGGSSSYTPSYTPTCGGSFYRGPTKQTCTNPNDYHCDIYAWNLAIDNGLDPRAGRQSVIDLNYATVSDMYNYY